ncbi:flagellar M-ring protein FliF C-terminal domain-containing protein [Kaarinaea lacus]
MAEDTLPQSSVVETRWRSAGIAQKAGILAGFTAMLILGVMIISWAWSPTYKVLFSSLPDKDAIAVLNALNSNGFDARLDAASGAIMVPGNDLHYARIRLSDLGLPGSRYPYTGLQQGSPYQASIHEPDSSQQQIGNNQNLENILVHRIEHLLQPLVGMDSVRAQVTINTRNNINEESNISGAQGEKNKQLAETGTNTNREQKHLSTQIGVDEYLSVTVILAEKQIVGKDGIIKYVQYKDQEIETLTDIIKNTVGFSSGRGDSIRVIQSGLIRPTIPDGRSVPGFTAEFFTQEWVKKGTGVVLLSLLITVAFLFLFKTIAIRPQQERSETNILESENNQLDFSEVSIENFENNVRAANTLAEQDPRLVAQVIRNWVHADG